MYPEVILYWVTNYLEDVKEKIRLRQVCKYLYERLTKDITSIPAENNEYLRRENIIKLENIEELDLTYNGSIGIIELKRLNIKKLKLGANSRIRDEELIQLPKLEDLTLSDNKRISYRGIKNIKKLTLIGETRMTDEGLKKLEQLEELTLIENSRITLEGIKILKKINIKDSYSGYSWFSGYYCMILAVIGKNVIDREGNKRLISRLKQCSPNLKRTLERSEKNREIKKRIDETEEYENFKRGLDEGKVLRMMTLLTKYGEEIDISKKKMEFGIRVIYEIEKYIKKNKEYKGHELNHFYLEKYIKIGIEEIERKIEKEIRDNMEKNSSRVIEGMLELIKIGVRYYWRKDAKGYIYDVISKYYELYGFRIER